MTKTTNRNIKWTKLIDDQGVFPGVVKPMSSRHIMVLMLSLLGGTASAEDAARQYHIPAQSLNNALLQFASDSNLELIIKAGKITDLNAKTLDGTMTPRQALDQLLKGSGYTYHFVDSHTVTLDKAPVENKKAEPMVLKTVSVKADAIRDVKDPYNEDYVIPNATSGTKTDTPIMETPLNVQVVSKQVLKVQQVISLDQALKNVSGVTTNGAGSKGSAQNLGLFPSFSLRGFESGVFFRDGFRLQQGAGNRSMANVEAVEVLKGPAAILYGQVEPGGMVNVITKQPLATPYYALGQQFGSYDLYRTTIDATGPVTKDDTLLYRFNFAYKDNGSFRDFVNSKDVFLAPVLKWNIGPRTQATFEFEYNHQNLNPDEGYVPFINGQLLNVPRNRNYGEAYKVTTETIFGGFHWSHQFNDDWSIKQRFSVNERKSSTPNAVTPYFAYPPSVYRSIFGFDSTSNTYSTSIDLTGHFNTLGLNHTLLTGGDYYRLDFNQSQRTNLLGADSAIDIYNPQILFIKVKLSQINMACIFRIKSNYHIMFM